MRLSLRTLGCTALTLAATGTATAAAYSGINGGDLYVLNSGSVKNALSISGQPNAIVANVYVNSTNGTAATIGGSAVVNTNFTKTVGGLKVINTATFTGQASNIGSPLADPYSALSLSLPGGSINLGGINANGNLTVNPGYYASGIKLNAGSNVTFKPGVYWVANGFDASSSCNMSGSGVTFVILTGSVSFSGSAVFNLSAPASGAYAGVVFAQAKTDVNAMSFTGGSNSVITGAIYAPKALIKLAGSSVVNGQGPHLGDVVVGDTVSIQGQGLITIGDTTFKKALTPPTITAQFD